MLTIFFFFNSQLNQRLRESNKEAQTSQAITEPESVQPSVSTALYFHCLFSSFCLHINTSNHKKYCMLYRKAPKVSSAHKKKIYKKLILVSHRTHLFLIFIFNICFLTAQCLLQLWYSLKSPLNPPHSCSCSNQVHFPMNQIDWLLPSHTHTLWVNTCRRAYR